MAGGERVAGGAAGLRRRLDPDGVLSALRAQGEPMTTRQLVGRLDYTSQTVNVALIKLLAAGRVVRTTKGVRREMLAKGLVRRFVEVRHEATGENLLEPRLE